MINQYFWIGITVVVFFVGMGVSYSIFSDTYYSHHMMFIDQGNLDEIFSENHMMYDSEQKQKMMNNMMMDSQFMKEKMNQMMEMHR